MNVNLTPYFEELIQQQVTSGRYANASEVVRDALRLMEENERERHEKLQALRAAIDEGENSPAKPLEDVEVLLQQFRQERNQRLLPTSGQG